MRVCSLPLVLVATVSVAAAQAPETPLPLSSATHGVTVLSTSPGPAKGVRVQVRCGTSINSSNEPLYVVDGVAVSAGPASSLRSLDTADILSISVLRGPEAEARFGTAARNGVVEITTRDGGRAQAISAATSPFPNPAPAGATVTVPTGSAGPVRVEVVDVLGRRVWASTGTGDVLVPTAGLARGAYVVRVGEGPTRVARRFTVL